MLDRKGKILVPGLSEAVAPVTEEELELYDEIDFDLKEYAKDVGAETLLHSCKVPRPPECPVWGRLWAGARGAGRDAACPCAWPSGGTGRSRAGAGSFSAMSGVCFDDMGLENVCREAR